MIDADILRRKIIDFAVFGKLTEHLPSEGDASEWLLNNDCQYFDSAESDIALPSNWCWTTLSRITDENTLNDGNWVLKADMVSEGAVKLIQLGSIGEGVYRDKGFKYLTEEHFHELNGRQIFPGYLLINRLVVDRMCSCIIPPIEGILMTAVDVCWVAPQDELYSLKYIMYAVSTSMFQQYVNDLGHGVTRFRISKNNLIEIPFPFPPLNEQIRIVDKIEELFLLLNTLNDLQQQYESDQEILKGKIIDAGIRGKLTEQLPEDGNADNLYAQIQEEKAKLIKEGKIKKEKALPEISEDEIPFEIPDNWKWVRFGATTFIERGGSPRPIKSYITDSENGINWIKIGDVEKGGKYIYSTKEKIIPEGEKKSRHVYPGDFLLTNSMSFGRPYISKVEGCIHDGWLLIRDLNGFSADYLYLLLSSSYMYGQFCNKASGATVDNLNIDKVNSALIPLPPLKEQKRIARTIEAILEQIS